MPAAMIELERLEGISEGTPQCMCLWRWVQCANASSWRIRSTCPECHHHATGFVCDRCHENGVLHGFACASCGGTRGIDRYL